MQKKPDTILYTVEIANGPRKVDPINDKFEDVRKAGKWHDHADCLIKQKQIDTHFSNQFHTYWTEHGGSIREQVNDDHLLIVMLKNVLPPYSGQDQILFRGENQDRWQNGKIGVCWTSSIETARLFGKGVNATRSGGILLKCWVPEGGIIAGPSDHSIYLGENEFTLDTTMLNKIEEIEKYPTSD